MGAAGSTGATGRRTDRLAGRSTECGREDKMEGEYADSHRRKAGADKLVVGLSAGGLFSGKRGSDGTGGALEGSRGLGGDKLGQTTGAGRRCRQRRRCVGGEESEGRERKREERARWRGQEKGDGQRGRQRWTSGIAIWPRWGLACA